MSGVDLANAVFELTGVAFGGILFYCGVKWIIGLFSRRRKRRAKGRYYSRRKRPRERTYGYSNYRKERSYSGRPWFPTTISGVGAMDEGTDGLSGRDVP